MSITSTVNQGTVTIGVSGRFSFDDHTDFRRAYEGGDVKNAYIIDMRAAEYMDSAALGMLLILREQVGGDQADIAITNSPREVRDILSIAGFERLFTIS